MGIKETQKKVNELITIYEGYWHPLSMLFRFIKKLSKNIHIKNREKKSEWEKDKREIQRDLTDIKFTLFTISNILDVNLNKKFQEKINKDLLRNKEIYY